MLKAIVTTTINIPTQALLKFITFKDWDVIVVGDLKTPHELYFELEKDNKNFKYLSPENQNELYKELSESIGWNKIQRRTIGYLYAYNKNYEIIATVDDDNIPFDNWGKNIYIGKEISTYHYETDEICFDPVGVTNYNNLWHRGFPLQLLKNKKNYKIKIKTIIPDIQADFWNGDPDIDAVCRMEHYPMCYFDDKFFPISTNSFSPFNQQNTFISRSALKYYLAIPFIGRMDDIWPSYYCQAKGFNVIYTKSSVFQDRNEQNLTTNLKNEFIGYENTLNLLIDLKNNSDALFNYLPTDSKKVVNLYNNYCIN